MVKVSNKKTSVIENNSSSAYQTRFIDCVINDGILLENLMITDINSKSVIPIEDLKCNFSDSIVVVCRFSEYSCDQCVMYAIEKAIEQCSGKEIKLMFWGLYDSDTSLRILKEKYALDSFDWYNVPEMKIPIEKTLYPYYFVLNSSLSTSGVFVPERMNPEEVDLYWELLTTRNELY